MEFEVGQVWRKDGPYDWLSIEQILDPDYPNYDNGCIGVVVKSFPPQLKGIQLRGGKRYFVASNKNESWKDQITRNRHLLKKGWKRGDNANSLLSV